MLAQPMELRLPVTDTNYWHDSEEDCIVWLDENGVPYNSMIGQMHIFKCLCKALWRIMTEPIQKMMRRWVG